MARTPADSGDHAADDELLLQRLASVARVSGERTSTEFRRRRSSGLLFQIRRRMRRNETPAWFTTSGRPPA